MPEEAYVWGYDHLSRESPSAPNPGQIFTALLILIFNLGRKTRHFKKQKAQSYLTEFP